MPTPLTMTRAARAAGATDWPSTVDTAARQLVLARLLGACHDALVSSLSTRSDRGAMRSRRGSAGATPTQAGARAGKRHSG
ncbi:MAG TPA: hypothetical protein VFS05_15355 [Gemmatimonadaceae bacterium]|nr:hypothetical protein [Gemmatimonadaceae bacterium]